MKIENQILKNRKRKIPSSVSLMNCLSNIIYNNPLYINFMVNKPLKSCGPTENRTRDFCVIDKCFTIKLLAHNMNMGDRLYKFLEK